MAKRTRYDRRRSFGARRLFLFLIVMSAVAFAAWKVIGSRPAANSAPPSAAVSDPPVVTPQQLAGRTQPAPAGRPGRNPDAPEPPTSAPASEPAPSAEPAAAPPPTAPMPPTPSVAEQLLEQGAAALQGGDVIAARRKLTLAVERGLSPADDQRARKLINQAADDWLFSRKVFENDPYCERYKVQPGDLLSRIAESYDVPYALLMRVNHISDPRLLRAGETIKVVKGPFRCKVDRSRFVMTVYLGETIARSYQVGLGAQGRDTPAGTWRIRPGAKVKDPEWTDPDTGQRYLPNDPENPLGGYWMGLDGIEGAAVGRIGFGIHGTIHPEQIGRAVSRGCIRLFNGDVQELFDMLIEGKTVVTVVD